MSSCAERERVETFHQAFGEDLFRDTVTRERRRADRSGLAIAMLLVGLQDSQRANAPALFARIARGLVAIRSDIDILGWFERESILGLIVPELDRANLTGVCERLESEFRKEITNRLEGDITEQLSIRLCVYPEPQYSGEKEFQAVDPFLYPEVPERRERIVMFRVLKRSLDIFGSLALLLILSPLLLAIAGLV